MPRLRGSRSTVLHSFTGADGASPLAAVIGDADGHLYGTTTIGGNQAGGGVYRISGQ
jgi:hypothetical protein